MMKRVKIKVLSRCSMCKHWKIGDIIELNEELADKMVRREIAEYVDEDD